MTQTLLAPPVPRVTGLAPVPMPGRRTWRPVDSLHRRSDYTQSTFALSYPMQTGAPADPQTSALVVVPHGGTHGSTGGMEAWAATFVQAVVEVIASDRPVTQLIRWTSRRVYAEISQRQRRVAQHRSATSTRSCRQHVATVRICRPAAGSAEVAARVVFGPRSRAVAVRLDYVNGRWMCTAICFG